MLKFKRTTITINGEENRGYSVEGLDTHIFRGLKVVLVKGWGWKAYEATTGISITPPSWAGGLSNKTREGILQILSNFLSNAPESGWTRIQEKLDYDLRIDTEITIEAKREAVKKAWIAKDKPLEWVEYAVNKLPDASIDFEYSLIDSQY